MLKPQLQHSDTMKRIRPLVPSCYMTLGSLDGTNIGILTLLLHGKRVQSRKKRGLRKTISPCNISYWSDNPKCKKAVGETMKDGILLLQQGPRDSTQRQLDQGIEMGRQSRKQSFSNEGILRG